MSHFSSDAESLGPVHTIYIGAPGVGKSITVNDDVCALYFGRAYDYRMLYSALSARRLEAHDSKDQFK
jgi:hypothetical protein